MEINKAFLIFPHRRTQVEIKMGGSVYTLRLILAGGENYWEMSKIGYDLVLLGGKLRYSELRIFTCGVDF